jgi:hypothetical protein
MPACSRRGIRMTPRENERTATALGLALGCALVPLVYAIVRVVIARLEPDPDPVAVVWSEHSPSITRLMITLYVTAALSAGAVAIARTLPERAPSMVSFAAIASAVAIMTLAMFAP